MTYATFPLVVEDIEDQDTLYRRLLFRIMRIEEHEAREYLRVAPTCWAPFHPHKVDGMKRWQKTKDDGTCLYDNDLQFGIA